MEPSTEPNSSYLASLSNGFEYFISSIESCCDTIADFGNHTLSFIGEKTAGPRKAAADKIGVFARPFWNLSGLIFRYALSPISWHLPRQIVWLEGHKELEASHPQAQRVERLVNELGLMRKPKVYLQSEGAWQLSRGGWSGIFQPTLVINETDSDGWIKRQLMAARGFETSMQMLSFTAIALSVGYLITFTAPYVDAAKLALIVGSNLISYIGVQIAFDTYTLDSLPPDERAQLKNHLAEIKALPLFEPSSSALSRIQSIPKALFLIPAYLRSILV